MSAPRALTALLVLAAAATLAGESLGLRGLVYGAKPLATIAVLLFALRAREPVSSRYRALIALGIVASLAGDVFLMLPGDRFIAGLASFLVAHLCYIGAFATAGGGLRDPGAAAIIAAVAAAVLSFLWSGLGALAIPVLAYVAVISAMAWQALARWRRVGGTAAAFAAAGAVAFLASDSALAVRRFRGAFPFATAVVLVTYWFAQWAIARSVARDASAA